MLVMIVYALIASAFVLFVARRALRKHGKSVPRRVLYGLPLAAVFTKSFEAGNRSRTAKVYLSPETPIRSYYTVIAIPDGADTAQFLRRSGWLGVADSCLRSPR